jgi:hypothetical protein
MPWIDLVSDTKESKVVVKTVMELLVPKMEGTSSVAEQLASSEEGIGSLGVFHKNLRQSGFTNVSMFVPFERDVFPDFAASLCFHIEEASCKSEV